MRIVAGKWRGRTLAAPEGRGTRPTTDRLRESVASLIASELGLDLEGVSVLDAFAGSGAMGFELVSRGTAHAIMVERDGRAWQTLRRNAQTLGAGSEEITLIRGDAFRVCGERELAHAPFDVVFLDPPYALAAGEVAKLVCTLDERGMLREGCLVVYERASKGAGLEVDGWRVLRTREQADTAVDLMKRDVTREEAM